MAIQEISVNELHEKVKNNNNFILLDVRNIQEILYSKINVSIHIPMNEIPERLDELNKDKTIVVHCKSGKRSAKVCEFLIQNNFTNVKNLAGGIKAWASEIDPSIDVL